MLLLLTRVQLFDDFDQIRVFLHFVRDKRNTRFFCFTVFGLVLLPELLVKGGDVESARSAEVLIEVLHRWVVHEVLSDLVSLSIGINTEAVFFRLRVLDHWCLNDIPERHFLSLLEDRNELSPDRVVDLVRFRLLDLLEGFISQVQNQVDETRCDLYVQRPLSQLFLMALLFGLFASGLVLDLPALLFCLHRGKSDPFSFFVRF